VADLFPRRNGCPRAEWRQDERRPTGVACQRKLLPDKGLLLTR
jgi:hypothetical protein